MLRYFLYVWFMIIPSFILYGQGELHTTSSKALKYYNRGKEHYNFFEYEKAVSEFKNAVHTDDNFIEAHLMLAEVSVDLKNYDDAIHSFKRAVEIDPDFFPNAVYNLAHIEHLSGRYRDAIDHFKRFLDLGEGSDKRIRLSKKGIRDCEFAIGAIENPVPFNPVNLGASINSELDEYWPSLTADEKTLVITVLVKEKYKDDLQNVIRQEDFYVSTFSDGKWTKRKNLGPPVNTDRNEGAQSLSVDGQYMFFTACNREDGLGSCDLYFSGKLGNRWSVATNLRKPVNSKYWESQPCLSADGNILYFISNRPGGSGGMDIWRSVWNDKGYWNEPVNLGDSINTAYDEMSPFIHPDNKTLYFASNGHPGLGGFDIFRSAQLESGEWGIPENIGYPINKFGDEIGLIVNARGDKAYFSSNELEERGKDIFMFDLYKEARPLPVSYMTGKVFDVITGNPLTAKFELTNLKSAKVIMEAYSGKDGKFLVCIPTDKNYALTVSKEGYLFFSEHFSLSGIHEAADPFYKDVPLHPITEGGRSILRNIFFEFNSYKLRNESNVELNRLLEFLEKNPFVIVEIGGHTDNIGTESYNLKLSENRAKAVYNYLIENNINRERLKYMGYGMSQPIDDNSTPEGRARNRRTEIKVIGKKKGVSN